MTHAPRARRWRHPLRAALALVALATAAVAQDRPACSRGSARLLEQGWRLLRADSATAAAARFSGALSACPASTDAMVGLGFAALRRGQLVQAESLFVDVTRRTPAYADAWDGLATARFRQGQTEVARAAWLRAIDLEPAHPGARDGLARLDPDWERRRRPVLRKRAASLDVTMRVWEERFEMRRNGRWQPFYPKGVLLDPALPGRAGEPPTDSATYADWLQRIAAMNANTVRVPTVLPPAFYRALRGHNLKSPTRPVLLLHGVRVAPPRSDGIPDSSADASTAEELRAVVDVVHGAADLASATGRASGWYDADVSPWSIGYIVDWTGEAAAAIALDRDPSAPRRFEGRHLRVAQGAPLETWLVRQCDRLLTYEETTYNAQRPIAYASRPGTDPIAHADAPAVIGGGGRERPPAVLAYDDEGVTLAPTRVTRTSRNLAGWFASYEVFPYGPDFLLEDPAYRRARSSVGPSNYFGYLQELKRAHPGIPILIAGFGASTSRGIAHLQPQGWHHGGLSESEQADIVVRLAREIREAGAAGAVVSSWLDGWNRTTWLTPAMGSPPARAPTWHDLMSPDQHLGVLAIRPGAAQGPTLGGDLTAWRRLPVVMRGVGDAARVRLGADPGFLLLALEVDGWRGRSVDWEAERLQIAIDTHRGDAGEFLLPTSGLEATVGFEFLLEFNAPDDAQLRVTPDYNAYTPARLVQGGPLAGMTFRRPVRSVPRRDAAFDSLYVLTNPARIRRDGSAIPADGVNQGRLRFGRTLDHSLADWWVDSTAGMLQVRIPWGLLNVTDPSTLQVRSDVDGDAARPTGFAVEATPGLRAAVVLWSPGPVVRWTVPGRAPDGTLRFDDIAPWRWPTWERPDWHTDPKPVYAALQRAWATP